MGVDLDASFILYDNEERYEKELEENLNACKTEFNQLFHNNNNVKPLTVCAPGRVNLIGEHIDYSEGFVFPMAIPLYTVICGSKNNHPNNICRIKSLEESLGSNNYVEFSLNDLKRFENEKKWANYIIGVVANFKGAKYSFDAVIKSNVPLGSGLSSSAALEVSTYTFMEHLSNEFTDKKEKALKCQKAEHDFALVPCGIMDQFISALGARGNALLIDCRSYESKLFPLNEPDVAILIINSNVKHLLEGTEYSSRRKQCEATSKLLGKKSMREVTIEELESNRNKIDDETYRRAKHSVTEIKRTLDAADALANKDMIKLGKLMNQSHDSLRDDFNVSCPELDSLVEICRKNSGVFGSRMTGGGFGGCTVTLCIKQHVNEIIENVKVHYKGKPSFYVCTPCDGARKL